MQNRGGREEVFRQATENHSYAWTCSIYRNQYETA